MNKIKAIKNETDYKEALQLIEALMLLDPSPDSDEGEQMSILATLIQDFENKSIFESLPDPIDAIKFRMEQADLKPVDLVPFIGSPSRVSEILSGKRKLTVEMMRALESGLGIPAKVLLRESVKNKSSIFNSWSNSLLKEMEKRGYFEKALTNTNSAELLQDFFTSITSPLQFQAMLRQSNYRSASTTDKHALAVWATCVLKKASKVKASVEYKEGTVDLSFMQELAKLSLEKDSPLVAQKFLKLHGILLIIEPHFFKTRLDGAVLFVDKNNPVIGLTLRHDRLDNFWFTLMHELAHIALHYNSDIEMFYDELENVKALEISTLEKEADNLAGEALVPTSKWEVSPARLVPSSLAAISLARELGVHTVIVAGKIRHEGGKFYYLNNLVGQAKVQQYFPDEKWTKK